MPKLYGTDRDGAAFEIEVAEGGSVMEALRDNGQPIEAACGGCCSCATCHVYIEAAWLDRVGPPGDMEAELLAVSQHQDEARSRLSCQIPFTNDLDGLRLTIAPEE